MNAYQYLFSSLLPMSVRSELQSFSFPSCLFAFSFAIFVRYNLSTILLVKVKPCHCVRNLKINVRCGTRRKKVYNVESLAGSSNFLDFHLSFVEARRFVVFYSYSVVQASRRLWLRKIMQPRRYYSRIWD